jgi:hypothetical protein
MRRIAMTLVYRNREYGDAILQESARKRDAKMVVLDF